MMIIQMMNAMIMNLILNRLNHCDALEIVKTISYQDLLDIGVSKLSHRKMILSKAQEVKQYPIMMDAPPGYDARNDTLHQQDGEVASVKEQVNCNNEPLPSEPGLEMELVKVDDEFIVNGFDALEIVKTISYQDLLDIGVSKLSHRKIILSKAQSLDNDKDDTPPECDAQHDHVQQERMNSNTSQHG
eukprot:372372_1